MAGRLLPRLKRLERARRSDRPCRVCRDGASTQEVVRFINVPGRDATGAAVAEAVPRCPGCRLAYGVVYVSGIDPALL